jgi:hypothetical protein
MSTVLFLCGKTMGDALGASGRGLRKTFEEQGHEFVEVNFTKPDAVAMLNATIMSKPVEFAFSHVGIGMDLQGETRDKREINLWTGMGIPFISLYGDSPAYYFDRHIVPGPGFACLYAFPEHYELRKVLPHRNGLLGVTPLKMIDETPKREIDFRKKESGKLLFLKNGNDPKRLIDMWREAVPVSTYVMLTDLASELTGQLDTDKSCNTDAAVCAYFQDRGLDIEELTNLRLFFVAQLDDYLRRVKSTWMAEVLRDFPVEIHGYNWEHVDFFGKRATLVHGADFTASGQMIKDALGVLDMAPNTSQSPHDRFLRSCGLYTLCLTNEQQFFSRHFESHSAFTFRFDQQSLENRVEDVLAHPKRSIDLGIEVAERFRSQFDSGAFCRTMLDIANCLRLAAGPRPASLQDFFVWPPEKLA